MGFFRARGSPKWIRAKPSSADLASRSATVEIFGQGSRFDVIQRQSRRPDGPVVGHAAEPKNIRLSP
jgi:hypothetical protein